MTARFIRERSSVRIKQSQPPTTTRPKAKRNQDDVSPLLSLYSQRTRTSITTRTRSTTTGPKGFLYSGAACRNSKKNETCPHSLGNIQQTSHIHHPNEQLSEFLNQPTSKNNGTKNHRSSESKKCIVWIVNDSLLEKHDSTSIRTGCYWSFWFLRVRAYRIIQTGGEEAMTEFANQRDPTSVGTRETVCRPVQADCNKVYLVHVASC